MSCPISSSISLEKPATSAAVGEPLSGSAPPSALPAIPSPPSSARPAGSATSTRRNRWERRLQIFCVRQFRKLVDPQEAILVSLENGEDRSSETLELLHALGVEDGLPDLLLLAPGAVVHFIEVKLGRTEQHAHTDLTEAQRQMHRCLRRYGFQVDTIRSPQEFWAVIDARSIRHEPVPPPRKRQLRLKLRRRRRR